MQHIETIVEGRAEVFEDEDGIVILVLAEPRMFPAHFARAAEIGVGAVLLADPVWAWMEGEVFFATAHEARNQIVADADHWVRCDGPAPYRTLVERFPAPLPTSDEHPQPAPTGQGGFVHIHTHSEFSPLDGVSRVRDMVSAAARNGQTAMALTDHGTCAAHPEFQQACDEFGIKPIFGQEANFVMDRRDRTDRGDYFHLTLLAENEVGLRNLWAATTEANRTGFFGRPRMDWEVLAAHNEGVIATTACLRGPISSLLLEGRREPAIERLGRLMDLFPGRLYVEVHTNGLDEQRRLNEALVELADEFDLPVIAVVDSHYVEPEQKEVHGVWMAVQTSNEVEDETGMFEGGHDYHLMSEAEVRERLSYLGEEVVNRAVANTVALAERCTARIEVHEDPPVFSSSPEEDTRRLVDMCMAGWVRRGLPTEGEPGYEAYAARFETEMRLLIDKRFCGYFLLVADYTSWAKDDGILVGPGRGSGGGSLVAYLARITEIDPVGDSDLLFERFLNPGRNAMPDFDLDFPSSKRDRLQDFLIDRWGEDRVVRIGTHLRMRNKGIVRKLASALKSTVDIDWVDIDAWSKRVDDLEADTAGLGLSWQALMERDAASSSKVLHGIRGRYPALFAYADELVGTLHAYGKHAAGFVVSTEDSLAWVPQRNAGDKDHVVMVSEWDMVALEDLGLVKLDLLTIRNLDTIQIAVDLIRERTGEQVNPYEWTDEYEDLATWEMLSSGRTLGVFQVETGPGTEMCLRLQPRSMADLSAVVTIVRPGPMESGLTDLYLRRHNGQEPVTYPHPILAEALSKTYGAMIYQEDIMAVCRLVGGYTLAEADDVRRILGKKKVDKVAAEGERFVAGAVANGIERDLAEMLWEQMGEFARYGFNRAHAWAYAMVAYWCAWLKRNHEVEFITAVLSTVEGDRIPEFVREARRLGIRVLPPDVNLSGRGFTATDDAVRYGFDSLTGIGDAVAHDLIERQPYTSFDDFRERHMVKEANSAVHRGHAEMLAAVGGFDSLYPNRRALETLLERERSGESAQCVFKEEGHDGPNGLPCHFDWANEPPVIGKSGRPLKQKPLPKRCTKACRMYTAPPPFDPDEVPPYTPGEIRDREMEMLGVYLSSTPFDDIAEVVREEGSTVAEIERSVPGEHYLFGLLGKVKTHTDRTGNKMAFLGGEDINGDPFDVVAFSSTWEKYRQHIATDGRVRIMRVAKTDRGMNLLEIAST